jgi:flagellar hook assembly protein FlgD
MKNFLREGLAKKVILFAFIVGLVSPAALAYTDGGYPLGTSPIRSNELVSGAQLVAAVAPSVQNLNVSTATGSATVSFSLNTNATTTVWIKDTTGTIVKTLIFDNNLSGGVTNTYTWNGTNNNGQTVSSGSYRAEVVAYNSVSSDIKSFSFNFSTGTVQTAPVVSVSAYPVSFEPSKGQTTTVSYTLNTSASLRVEVKSGSSVVRTLRAQSEQGAGSYQLSWDGKNADYIVMAPGTYTVEVYASNGAGSDLKSTTVTVVNTPTEVAPVVSVSANPTSFEPSKGQTTTVTYSLNTSATLKVEVKQNGSLVRTLRSSSAQSAGSYSLTWDGRDNSGNLLGVNTYTVEVYASNGAGSDLKSTSVSIVSNPSVTAPNLTNVYASPTPFNPNNENTRVYFNLDKTADVTVSILDGSSTIRTLVSGTSLSAGTYYYEWNGRNSSGNMVSDNVYNARVLATNSAGSDTENTSVEVRTSGSGTCDIITGQYVNPTSFDPSQRDAQINYNLSRSATVTVRIMDNSNTFRTLLSYQNQSSGQQYVSWNGKDSSGTLADDQTYTYEIRATANGCSDDVETGSVRVYRNGDNESDWASTDEDLIRDVIVRNEVFDPTDGERSTVEFTLDRRADLKVQVMDGNTVVKTLRDTTDQAGGDYSYTWDGRDSHGDIMNDDVYQFRVMADDGDDTDTDRAYVEVDTDGIIIGFPDSNRCAGYRDVSVNSPFCKAIELMSQRGIFSGYSDGTFRPNANINRAETVKVVTLALGYSVNTGGSYNLGYRDTTSSAWYAPYLYEAKRQGIATGYPDNTFRPSSTINRVELLRVFLEGNQTDLYTCNTQPYDDTPINPDTRWYMKYACYAKDNGLMGTDNGYRYGSGSNMLYPAEAMTRGDVADLFYDFEVNGLYSDFVLSRTGYYGNTGNSRVCVEYSSNGGCSRYEYRTGSNNNYYCAEYDSNDTCVRYTSSSSNNDTAYCTEYGSNGRCLSYSYSNNNYNSNSDGYYVYRNGRYVWVSY